MRQEHFHLEQPKQQLNLRFVGMASAKCSETSADNVEHILTKGLESGEISLFRGVKGRGFLCTGERSDELPENALLLLPTHELTAAVPNAEEWQFYQFRFIPDGPVGFIQEKTPYTVPFKKEEELLVKELFYQQYSGASFAANLIAALFLGQLYRWGMELETTVKAENMYLQKIQFAIEYINLHLHEPLSISELSAQFSISERHFRQLFRQVTGKSPKSYQGELRLNKCAHLLNTTELSIQEISDSLGYYSQYQLSRDFKKFFGLSPSDYRKGNFI